jgi:hypothetical protein
MANSLRRDERGVSPVVGKTLAAGLTLLYVASMTGLLLSGVVPEYETATGDEVADRVLSTAAGEIERTAAQPAGDVTVRRTVDLPPTIKDAGYRLVLSGETLVLDHPDDQIGGDVELSLPPEVAVESGAWESDGQLLLRVSGPEKSRRLAMGEDG